MQTKPELLAPAGSMEALTAALRCGADAVYVGAKRFSARAHAENFDAETLPEAARLCHLYGAKLYAAVNTLLTDSEFAVLDNLLLLLADSGADGCIVQDLGVAAYIAKRLPTMRLHASTQLTVHSPAGVRFAKQAGFCRAVAARELSKTQLAALCREAETCGMEIEAFVHGAHCMSVSGQCFLSAAMGGRSANRGCCAQPCRLPFTADPKQRNACALSLKDLSLTAHLGELCEMGVRSLKIEGRMKRPEYVAAAVTACRAALNGQQPDLDTLRAVFSRDGFTDGYFTGLRKEMFGTRQKADVVAAQDVLAPLRETYKSPRRFVTLDAAYVLHANEPAKLTVTDGTYSVTVTGDIPQTAQNRPTDTEALRKQFEKLGGTVYLAGNVTAEIDRGLMLPASALNAMRREAVEQMNTVRIQANTPQHSLSDIPQTPVLPDDAPAQTEFRLQIRRMEQLRDIAPFADRIAYLMLPLSLAGEYARTPQAIPVSRCILVPPRFVCDENKVLDLLKAAQQLGYSHMAVQHPGDAVLGKMLGMTLHGGFGMHAANKFAARFLHDYGLSDLLCAQEAACTPQLGLFAYGKLPLMLMRNCPVQAQVGCARCRHTLTDRKGAAVYTDCTRICEKPDYAELFNAAAVWLADRSAVLRNAAYALLFLTDESPERTAEVLSAYLEGKSIIPPHPFTRRQCRSPFCERHGNLTSPHISDSTPLNAAFHDKER